VFRAVFRVSVATAIATAADVSSAAGDFNVCGVPYLMAYLFFFGCPCCYVAVFPAVAGEAAVANVTTVTNFPAVTGDPHVAVVPSIDGE
jgi:hypothetical protein